ncbi:hypothetical protein D3C86_1768990 [compost metagenome]
MSLGDVPRHRNTYLLVRIPARRPHDVDDASVLAHVTVLEIVLQLAAHQPVDRGQRRGPVGFVDQVHHRAPHHLFGRVAEDLFAGAGHAKEDARLVHDTHGVQEHGHQVGRRRSGHEDPWLVSKHR